MAKLTSLQERFCLEYMVDLNATQACIRAGYSKKYADRRGHALIENNRVKEEITRLKAEVSSRISVTVDDVISGILDVIEDAKKEGKDMIGNSIMQDRASALRGYDLLGKHLGMFDKKSEDATSGLIEALSNLADRLPN